METETRTKKMEEIQYPYCVKEENVDTSTELEVNIDFDLAKSEWRKNKKHIGNGMFEYTCKYVHSSGKKCNGSVYLQSNTNKYDYNFGGTGMNYNSYQSDDPIIKKGCKRHKNRI